MSAYRSACKGAGSRAKTIGGSSEDEPRRLAASEAAVQRAALPIRTTAEQVEHELVSYSDFAAISYIWIRLKGRASRLRCQAARRASREFLLLGEPIHETGPGDRLLGVHDPHSQRSFERIIESHSLRKVIHCLTEKELALLFEAFWKEKSISQLCAELHVSKNSILKMKRNALKKLNRALDDIEREG